MAERGRWVLVLRLILIQSRIQVHGMVLALIYGGLLHLSSPNLWTLSHTHAQMLSPWRLDLSRFKGITRHLVKLSNSSHGNTTTYLLVMVQG